MYHAIREKLHHKLHHALRAKKEKISMVLIKPYCSLANHNQEFQCVICTVLHLLHSFLSPSELSNFFVYIILIIIIIIIVTATMAKQIIEHACNLPLFIYHLGVLVELNDSCI